MKITTLLIAATTLATLPGQAQEVRRAQPVPKASATATASENPIVAAKTNWLRPTAFFAPDKKDIDQAVSFFYQEDWDAMAHMVMEGRLGMIAEQPKKILVEDIDWSGHLKFRFTSDFETSGGTVSHYNFYWTNSDMVKKTEATATKWDGGD